MAFKCIFMAGLAAAAFVATSEAAFGADPCPKNRGYILGDDGNCYRFKNQKNKVFNQVSYNSTPLQSYLSL